MTADSKSCPGAAERDKLFHFTSDGATLVGMVLGRGRSGLVLGHHLGSDLCEWLPQARAFAERGYRVLLFDFAGFGDSQHGPADSRVDTDVVAAAADQPFLEQAKELRDAARAGDPAPAGHPGRWSRHQHARVRRGRPQGPGRRPRLHRRADPPLSDDPPGRRG